MQTGLPCQITHRETILEIVVSELCFSILYYRGFHTSVSNAIGSNSQTLFQHMRTVLFSKGSQAQEELGFFDLLVRFGFKNV